MLGVCVAVTQGLDGPWVLCMCCFGFVDLEALGMFIFQIFLNSVVPLGCCCYLSAHVGMFGLHDTCFENKIKITTQRFKPVPKNGAAEGARSI
jgi:hypothetical protein